MKLIERCVIISLLGQKFEIMKQRYDVDLNRIEYICEVMI